MQRDMPGSVDRTLIAGARPTPLAFLFRLGGSRRGDVVRVDPAGTLIAEDPAINGAGSVQVRAGFEEGTWFVEAAMIEVRGRPLRTALQDGDRIVVAGAQLAFRIVD